MNKSRTPWRFFILFRCRLFSAYTNDHRMVGKQKKSMCSKTRLSTFSIPSNPGSRWMLLWIRAFCSTQLNNGYKFALLQRTAPIQHQPLKPLTIKLKIETKILFWQIFVVLSSGLSIHVFYFSLINCPIACSLSVVNVNRIIFNVTSFRFDINYNLTEFPMQVYFIVRNLNKPVYIYGNDCTKDGKMASKTVIKQKQKTKTTLLRTVNIIHIDLFQLMIQDSMCIVVLPHIIIQLDISFNTYVSSVLFYFSPFFHLIVIYLWANRHINHANRRAKR